MLALNVVITNSIESPGNSRDIIINRRTVNVGTLAKNVRLVTIVVFPQLSLSPKLRYSRYDSYLHHTTQIEFTNSWSRVKQ